MVVRPVGLLISMICFTCSLVGCYTVCREHGEKGQAGDHEQVFTEERERHGCWASWTFDECDLFHMFIGWMLHVVHSVHSAVRNGPVEGQRVEGRREHCAGSSENTAQGPWSRVQGQGRKTEH